MSKRTLISEAEVVEPGDLNAIGQNAFEGDENILGGAIGYPLHWADFTIETPTAQTIRINEGRLFEDSKTYDLDASLDLDLLVHLPTVVGDQRYVAIIVRGVEETVNDERFFETNVDTGATAALQTPKTFRRTCEFVVQQGLPSPTPLKPEVADSNCTLCYVLLGTAGIVSVESANDDRVKTLYEVEGRVTVLEGQMVIAFARTTTLATDLANLQATLKDYARKAQQRQLQEDMARVRRLLNLPDAARAYFYDPGLVKTQWDLANGSWDARVDEGVRFPFAATNEILLEVQNTAQADIRIYDGVLMPDWDEERRIEVDGTGSTVNISQQVHTVVTPVQHSVSRSAVSYGPTVALCGNTSEYSNFDAAATGQTFQQAGVTFEKVAAIDSGFSGSTIDTTAFNATHGGGYDVDKLILHNAQAADSGNRTIYAARSVSVSSWTDTYWTETTETFGINGSVYGQTFLLTQPMVLASIELAFSRAAATGDVTLMLCKTSSTGEPLFDAVIAKSTLTAAEISVGWVSFPFTPRYLEPGKRYAWVTVTTGNHALRTVTGAKYTQGSMFHSTDLAWFQGSTDVDFCFRVNACAFNATRVQVLFNPVTLTGGMTEIKMIYENWAPDGTAMMWEVRPTGATAWATIQPETDLLPNPLRGLPALCELRLTMIGTTGLAPAIILNANATVEATRPKTGAVAFTKTLDFGLSTTSIDVDISLDEYVDETHTFVPSLIVAGTPYAANSVSISTDIAKAKRRIVKADFTVPSTTSAVIKLTMGTSDVQSVHFVEYISAYAN